VFIHGLKELPAEFDRAEDDSLAIDGEYLEVVMQKR